MEVRLADATMLATSGGALLARADGFASEAAVWRALAERPGLAIASRSELESLPAVQTALEAGEREIRFAPASVWARDPRGGPARKLTVVGVTADGAIVPAGLVASAAALAGSPAQSQPQNEFFMRVREDVSYRSAATGVALTFPENGVRTRVLGDEQRTGYEVRSLLDTLVRGFLGMGLASGIAALGVVGMRSVAERRQQIGMLRALGFSRRMVQASFLLEGSAVAMLGITVGGVVGLVLARNVVAFLARDFRELELLIPWWQLGAIALAAYATALISGVLVAWQAGPRLPRRGAPLRGVSSRGVIHITFDHRHDRGPLPPAFAHAPRDPVRPWTLRGGGVWSVTRTSARSERGQSKRPDHTGPGRSLDRLRRRHAGVPRDWRGAPLPCEARSAGDGGRGERF
jgi:putative ABC transport system permease protein